MCTTNIYTYVHPDGYQEQVSQPAYCNASQYGQPCPNPLVFQHPPQMVGYADDSAAYLPPTPQYSTSPSSHRSGDESDRSRNSSNSSKKRSSGIYYNGQKVLPLKRRDRHERIVVVENPPTPRTPPQIWTAPHTAPPSPSGNTYVIETSPRDASRRQPLIVDERNRPERHVQIEIVDNDSKRRRSRSHSRHTSTSSSHSDEEEKRRRRRQDKKREEEEIRDQVIRARIAKANAEINSRPAVPMAPAPKRASTYKRPAVEVRDAHADLVDAVRRMDIREERARVQEDEAQRQRLKERMMPNRRASVGPGSRRHRVLYDDGLYRYE